MINKSITVFLLTTLIVYSCEKNDNEFQGINGESDWNLNDEFNEREKNLFDTLDFNNTSEFIISKETQDSIQKITKIEQPRYIYFNPNPFSETADFHYPFAPIINVVIVDKHFKKIIEGRFEDSDTIVFNLSDQPSGIYRLYYVIQNKDYSIVHLGHGNIEKQ